MTGPYWDRRKVSRREEVLQAINSGELDSDLPMVLEWIARRLQELARRAR